jgi:Skp family chaperone for outer membrane proteins
MKDKVMAKITGILALVAVVALGVSCGKEQQPQVGRVGVISLDRVADELGRKAAIDEEFKTRAQGIEQAARTEVGQLQQQFQQAQQRAASQPTDAEKQHLAELQRQIAGRLQELQQQVNQQQMAIRNELVTKFRDEVKPVAQSVAEGMGLSLVLVQGEFVLYTAPTVDISDAVIARLKQAPATQ